jgi:hypothetical protein
MRTLATAALGAALLTAPLATPPASAAGVVVLNCNLLYNGATGVGNCLATGVVGTGVMNGGAVFLSFNSWPGCPNAQASGEATGALRFSFDWQRVGATAAVTTRGDVDGGGVAQFSLPCQPVTGPELAVLTIAGS